MHVDTTTYFWRIKLYFMRLTCWTVNYWITLVFFAWLGPFGLRCLFGIDDFSYDENCDYETGKKSEITRKTVLGKFKRLN